MRWFVVVAAVVLAVGVLAVVRAPALMGGYGPDPLALLWLLGGIVGAAAILGAGLARRARHDLPSARGRTDGAVLPGHESVEFQQ